MSIQGAGGELAATGPALPEAVVTDSYMPMGIGDFCAVDPDTADAAAWQAYLQMKVRMVRDRRETPEATEYFDKIQTAYEESFAAVTPELLANPSKMNLVRCVDPYTEQQLDDLNFPKGTQISLPSGLAWFDVTGTMHDWIVPRIFNPELAAGMHRNCGGLAIIGALTGERQAMSRDRALTNALRIVAETASIVRQEYVRGQGRSLDPDAARVLATFGGPKLTFPIGSVGSAEAFVTPKALHTTSVDRHFTPREIIRGVESWVDGRLQSK